MADRWQEIERVGLKSEPGDMFVMMFVQCAAAGCRFELVARRYADNTPELRPIAFKDLSQVVDAICSHVRERTSDEERALLRKCVDVRNKLFHLELSRTSGHLKAFGLDIPDGGVTLVDLTAGTSGKVGNVSTKTGRIYGWLIEAHANGTFKAALEQVFRRGIALIGWLRAQDVENEPSTTDED